MNKKGLALILGSSILVLGVSALSITGVLNKGKTEQTLSQNNDLIESSSTDTSSLDIGNIVKEELYSEGNGRRIYGYITAPKNYKENKLPTIIISHGFGGLAERGDYYAQNLAKEGYVVYSFDFMGGNRNSRSGNNTLAMSVFTEMDDLDVVVKNLQEQIFVDKNNIFLLGQSQGGVVSTMEGAKLKDEIKGLILVFPAFVLFDDARDVFKSVAEIPEVYNHRGNNVGRVYFEKSLDYDIFKDMKDYKGKVLIVHGTNDNIAPISYSRRAIETFSNATLKEILGAGHGFNTRQQEETQKYINEFLKESIR
ncbi:alpha/beta hydrolase family protein [Gemella cuniculi]|uniref:alpha/beta hydrolase family protein n=1 Tax=Gemella cuniculi TaxID=150240 RepID=UPI00041C7D21|nr:alpha/beta fold hydrolase [Gemella cuniculi]